jgi:uncharacterized membrane protein affecting hemolysin expression
MLGLISTGQIVYPIRANNVREGYMRVLRPFLPHEGQKCSHRGEIITVRKDRLKDSEKE